jgi:NAD(P)-dependent dehydrogenase (short-subunit alcohol dehydrogenase family)
MNCKIAIITGANSGVGFETAVGVAAAGYEVIMACRSEERAQSAKRSLLKRVPDAKLEIILLDLNSLVLIRKFAAEFRAKYDHLDILINNAGIFRYKAEYTEDGFEVQFGVNYLGHFLLTALLVDMMPNTSGSRVVSVSSVAHKSAIINLNGLNYEKLSSLGGTYSQSKLACLMFSDELQRRLEVSGKEVLSVCAHPGGTETPIFDGMSGMRRFLLKYFVAPFVGHSNERAARSLLYATFDANVAGGEYFGPQGVFDLKGLPGRAGRTEYSKNLDISKKLWEESERMVNCEFVI